jgi:hypothetical protein
VPKRLEVRGKRVTPFTPKWGNRTHLTTMLKPAFGEMVEAVCGRRIVVGVGGGVETARYFLSAHESLTCDGCRTALYQHGRITE